MRTSWAYGPRGANFYLTMLRPGVHGLYHFSAAGKTSWCGFACAILAGAGLATPVTAIRTEDYPAPAMRPRYSRLDCSRPRADSGVALAPCEEGLAEVIDVR